MKLRVVGLIVDVVDVGWRIDVEIVMMIVIVMIVTFAMIDSYRSHHQS